ncbi:MAG TPA: PEP-CTERM sorting domain-containing protein [Chthoniobacterales bacterium]
MAATKKGKTMSLHNRILIPRIDGSVLKTSLLLLVAVLLFAVQASAANLIQNGSFQSGDFTAWTIGATSNGTWGDGFPIVTAWPLGGMNAAQGEVGEVNFDGTFQGGTLSQDFVSGAGAASLSFDWAAMGDGMNTNADGGNFELILDGITLANFDVGTIGPNDLFNGTISANTNLTAGMHTLEIAVLRPFISIAGSTPYQYVTNVDVEGAIPEPSSVLLLGIGALGLVGFLRRKRHV